MSIYKRGKIYWYKFMFKSQLVRESTKQGNQNVARQIEAAHRASLAKGEVGIREQRPVPTLHAFSDQKFEPWARSATSRKTWLDHYAPALRSILAYAHLADLRLDRITSEGASDFAAWRQARGMQVSSINSYLKVLRRMLHLAVEWGALERVPKIKMLPGERRREHVVTQEEEARYLSCASPLLSTVAIVLADTGMRPDECYRLRWEAITWSNGRNGTLLVTYGKTSAARRVLPMTVRVRTLLERRWGSFERPREGWVWPAATRSGHIHRSSLKREHTKAISASGVRSFVLYSLRHTFLTRLGESGCDVWTLARIAGHSSVAISARYVHPSEEAVLKAVDRLTGHRIGHIVENAGNTTPANDVLVA
jgi:integrase